MSKPSQSHSDEQVHTLVDGITGNVEGTIRLAAIPLLPAHLELDEMSLDECGRALRAGDLSEIVVLRPIIELNLTSLLEKLSWRRRKLRLVRRADQRSLKILWIHFIP